jgi:hypothetical protein
VEKGPKRLAWVLQGRDGSVAFGAGGSGTRQSSGLGFSGLPPSHSCPASSVGLCHPHPLQCYQCLFSGCSQAGRIAVVMHGSLELGFFLPACVGEKTQESGCLMEALHTQPSQSDSSLSGGPWFSGKMLLGFSLPSGTNKCSQPGHLGSSALRLAVTPGRIHPFLQRPPQGLISSSRESA